MEKKNFHFKFTFLSVYVQIFKLSSNKFLSFFIFKHFFSWVFRENFPFEFSIVFHNFFIVFFSSLNFHKFFAQIFSTFHHIKSLKKSTKSTNFPLKIILHVCKFTFQFTMSGVLFFNGTFSLFAEIVKIVYDTIQSRLQNELKK
jgi:hypothetical protein